MRAQARFNTLLAATVLLVITVFVFWRGPGTGRDAARPEPTDAGRDVRAEPARAIEKEPSPSGSQESEAPGAEATTAEPELNELPVPAPSLLAAAEQRQAISLFNQERERWLSLRTLSAECELTETFFDPATKQFLPANGVTATLKAEIIPLEKPISQNYVQIRLRLESEAYGGVVIQTQNVCDMKTAPSIWATGSDVPSHVTRAARRGIYEGLPLDDMFMMIRHMHGSFSDAPRKGWALQTRDQFFQDRGTPVRKSSEQETRDVFGGENQYLFQPGNYFLKYWFSADNGELRSMDMDAEHSSDGVGKTVRYENYAYPEDQSTHFPTEISVEARREGRLFRWQVKLSNVQINQEMPPGEFLAPREGILLR